MLAAIPYIIITAIFLSALSETKDRTDKTTKNSNGCASTLALILFIIIGLVLFEALLMAFAEMGKAVL